MLVFLIGARNINLIDVSSVHPDVVITTQDNVLVEFVILASSSGNSQRMFTWCLRVARVA
jgi:hypothetical protein